MKRPATSTDVARRAGVSQSTVSLVLSGKDEGRVTPETAERVRQAARELDYEPNAVALNLKRGRADVVALVVPTVTQPYFASVLVEAEKEARQAGCDVILFDSGSDDDWTGRLTRMVRSRQLDGAIVWAPTEEETQALEAISPSLVLVEAGSAAFNRVDLQIEEGAELVGQHLQALGHRHIGYFGVHAPRDTYLRRQRALRAYLDVHGGKVVEACSGESPLELDAAEQAAGRLVDAVLGDDSVTAVVCDDDLLAAAFVTACGESGVPVPGRLSVVGYGDLSVARLVRPQLTTVRLPTDVGGLAMNRLLRAVHNPGRSGTQRKPAPLSVPVTLVERASTGPSPSPNVRRRGMEEKLTL
jgi:DNA-binding LacI/PurR family transcriptional regulator